MTQYHAANCPSSRISVTVFLTPSYTCGQNARGMRPLASSEVAGSMAGTAAWDRVRQVMLNMISVDENSEFIVGGLSGLCMRGDGCLGVDWYFCVVVRSGS